MAKSCGGSTAPIVQLPYLATPRWSVRGQTKTLLRVVPVGIAPTAGLSYAGRMVSVGPPCHGYALFPSTEGPCSRPVGRYGCAEASGIKPELYGSRRPLGKLQHESSGSSVLSEHISDLDHRFTYNWALDHRPRIGVGERSSCELPHGIWREPAFDIGTAACIGGGECARHPDQ
jgi:hypothetical protein